MRHLVQILIICSLSTVAFAGKLDRTQPPKPGPAPEIKMGKIHEFTTDNGLTIYVVERRKTPMVTFSLVLDVDPVLQGDAVGYVQAAGQMLARGTKTRDKLTLDTAIDAIGANISTNAVGMTGSALSRYKDDLMALMADMMINSDFKQEELDKVIKQRHSALKSAETDPQQLSGRVRAAILFGDEHPYGELETHTTLDNISLKKVTGYYETYFKPNVSHLALVGDISVKDAKKLVKKYLSGWEKGEVPNHTYEAPAKLTKTKVAIIDNPGAVQTVLSLGNVVDLKPGTEDAISASLLRDILGGAGGRLFENLREDKAFTYGAYAQVFPDPIMANFNAFSQVRTEVTKEATQEFLNEFHRIRDEQIPEPEMQTRISIITGRFARDLESPQQLGTFAINSNIYDFPEGYYANYLKSLASNTPSRLQTLAQKIITPDHLLILAVGNGPEIEKALADFGDITFYDSDGQKIDPNAATVPEGLTAAQTLERYIQAVGGVDAINSIQDTEFTGKLNVPGMPLDMVTKFKAPNKMYMTASMNGQEIIKSVFDGEAGYLMQMGNKSPFDETTAAKYAIDTYLIPEMVYEKLGVKTELSGAEMIDGEVAYKVTLTYPQGTVKHAFYSAETGLKVRVLDTQKGPQGEVPVTNNYKEYREVNGVMLPYKVERVMGPMTMEMVFGEGKANQGLDETTFNAGS
jgi:predicted Zn-dependent peptidase